MSSSSSYYHNEHLFKAPHHQEIYQKYIHKKGVTPEKAFDLQEGQYPEIAQQISLRGWRRLSKPRTKISKDLVHEFYSNAVRTEEELASGEDYPYTSFVKGKEVDFSAAKIRDGYDVRVEELIADNIVVLAEGVQGRSKLCFPSIIYRLCKEAGVPMGEFKDSDKIQIARPITAKVMTTTRGRIINQPQSQPMEEDEDNYDAENLYFNHDQDQEMHFEAAGAEEDHYQYHEQPNFEAYESNFQQYKEDQQQGFNFLNEELASMKIRQEQFFESMQKAHSQYLEELKSLRTRQDEMVNQQNNFYKQKKREQEKTIKEIEEVKKFQVSQTLMGAQRTTEEKLEERVHETRNEIIEMRKQIRDWTRNASSREGYCCWAHQQANPNLVEIPPHKIPDFLHNNVANKKDPYYEALKSDIQQGESSQAADQPTQNPPNP
ncbi:hypothetical protein PIB30_081442 [Stylosanthes scabra]|uniref:Uncharacterized protein n=1 Tax=Stylosanthes scabra TaxID=79078 RepID=A0ABU6ZQF3_9FABA|nr:hypothetical protein [Stylosanthes scabra]